MTSVALTRTPLSRPPRLQRFQAALPTRTGCHSGAWRVVVQELVGVRMSVAVQAFARQGRSSIDSQALRVPAYPAPVVERAPMCPVGVIHRFGTGWPSSYQMKTATLPALYAVLLRTG